MTFAIGGTARPTRIIREKAPRSWTCDHCTITLKQPLPSTHERCALDALGSMWMIRDEGSTVAHRVNGARYKRCPGCGRKP